MERVKHLKSGLESERHQSGDHIYSVHIFFYRLCTSGGCHSPRLYSHRCDRRSNSDQLLGVLSIDHTNFQDFQCCISTVDL